ncbi:unnamed protein product [Gadus morhua 'NCC']
MKGDHGAGEGAPSATCCGLRARGRRARPGARGPGCGPRAVASAGLQRGHERPFALQLVVWFLRGVSRVILASNPLSGALILAALIWASPWQGLLGAVGVLASTSNLS